MRGWFAFLLALVLSFPVPVQAQTGVGIQISAPASGDTLRGLVNVNGTSAVDGFFSAELSFAYTSDPDQNWFLLASLGQPVSNDLLFAWDTATVTDGDYDLRLRVTLQDGSTLDALVMNLHIRNQTPTETPTLEPTFTPESFEPTLPPTYTPIPSPTPQPTPTPLPPNPAAVTQPELTSSLTRGLIVAILAFIVIGFLLRLHK